MHEHDVTNHDLTNHDLTGQYIRNIDLRRAVLGVLLRSERSMTISQVVDALRTERVRLGHDGGPTPRKKIADLPDYQRRIGRVQRIERGRYRTVPSAFTSSMRWRCLHWERAREHAARRRVADRM